MVDALKSSSTTKPGVASDAVTAVGKLLAPTIASPVLVVVIAAVEATVDEQFPWPAEASSASAPAIPADTFATSGHGGTSYQ
jgi:hypothetical protein